jgi:hypothetical protein
MTHRFCVCTVVVLLCVLMNLSCGSLAWSEEFTSGRQVGVVETDLIREASGIVASRRYPGVLWVHNDSGDGARLYALDTKGKLLGVCTVTGARARDWEDIAIGPGPVAKQHYLYIGDIGDNSGKYASVRIYRVPEPKVDRSAPFGRMHTEPVETMELTYPDKARDAETLLVDPQTGDLCVISKRDLFSKVYWAPYPQSTASRIVMKHVATLPWGFAVAGDVSPDGSRVIVRSPYNASLWVRPKGMALWHAFGGKVVGIPLMSERQGEGISFDGQGRGYFTLSEMANPPLHYFGPTESENKQGLSDGVSP